MQPWQLEAQQLDALEVLLGTKSDDSTLTGVRLNGVEYLAHLRLDLNECRRRSSLGLGAVTSTGVLHALWPTSIRPIPRAALDTMNLNTLDALPDTLVSHDENENIVRRYNPIGEIVALCSLDKSISQAIKKAVRIPPIFERLCIWTRQGSTASPNVQSLTMARRARTGIISLCDTRVEELVRPHDRVPGIPAVYRWWIAELAYDTVLTSTI